MAHIGALGAAAHAIAWDCGHNEADDEKPEESSVSAASPNAIAGATPGENDVHTLICKALKAAVLVTRHNVAQLCDALG